MKKHIELPDTIGEQRPLTELEEKKLSEFFKERKQKLMLANSLKAKRSRKKQLAKA